MPTLCQELPMSHLQLVQCCRADIVSPILQMRKLRLREVEPLDHKAVIWQRSDWPETLVFPFTSLPEVVGPHMSSRLFTLDIA